MEQAVKERESTSEKKSNPSHGFVENIEIKVCAVYASAARGTKEVTLNNGHRVFVRMGDAAEESGSQNECPMNDEFVIWIKTNSPDFMEPVCKSKRTWPEFVLLKKELKQHKETFPDTEDAEERIYFIQDCLKRWVNIDECRMNSLFFLFLSHMKFDIKFRDGKTEDALNEKRSAKIFQDWNCKGWKTFTNTNEARSGLEEYIHDVLFASIEEKLDEHRKRAKSIVDLTWHKQNFIEIQIRPVLMFVKFPKIAKMFPLLAFLVRPGIKSDFIVDVNFTDSARKYHSFSRFMKEFVMPWQDNIKIFYQKYRIEQANSIVQFQLDKDGMTAIEERYVSFFARKLVQRISTSVGIFSLCGTIFLLSSRAWLPKCMSATEVTSGLSVALQYTGVATTIFGFSNASRFFHDRKTHGQKINIVGCAESRMHAIQIASTMFAAGRLAMPKLAQIGIMTAEGRLDEITKLDRILNNTIEVTDLALHTCSFGNSVPRLLNQYKYSMTIEKRRPLIEKMGAMFFLGVDTASTSLSFYGLYKHCGKFEFTHQLIRRVQKNSLTMHRQNVDDYMEKVTEFWAEETSLCQAPIVDDNPNQQNNVEQIDKTNMLLEAGSKAIRHECRNRCAQDRPNVMNKFDQIVDGCIMGNGEELGRNFALKTINGLKIKNENGMTVIMDWQPFFDAFPTRDKAWRYLSPFLRRQKPTFFVLKGIKHQWNVVGNDIQTTRLLENDRIYKVAIDGASANRFLMPGTKSTKRSGEPIELKEVSEQLTMEGIIPTLEHQRDAIKEVCTSSQKKCGDNIDQQNFVFTLMIGHLDTHEFHKNENDYLHKNDRERMESVGTIAHGNMMQIMSETAKQQVPLFERITRDVSKAHKDDLFGKVATLHIAKECATNPDAANSFALACEKGLDDKWPDTRASRYSEPCKNETYAWDPRDLTYNYAVVLGVSTDDRRGKCGTFGAFTTKDHYQVSRWFMWDKSVRANTDWSQRSADFAACKYAHNSGHIRSTYFDASMFFDIIVKNAFISVINPVAGFSGMVTDIIVDFASVHMNPDNFQVFKLFIDTSRNLLCGLVDGLDPKQFLLETTMDGIGLIDPGLEIFGQACKGFSGATFALKAGESTLKAIKCVGTGMGNAAGCPEIGLVTGVACGLADYGTTANSKSLFHAVDNASAALLGTPPGMIVVGDMAVTAIRNDINDHHNFTSNASTSHGIGDCEARVFALPDYDDNFMQFEENTSEFIEQSQLQQIRSPKEANIFVGASHNEKDLWIAKYFNDEGQLDLDGYRESNWFGGQKNEDYQQMTSTSASTSDDSSGRGAGHLLLDGLSDANTRFYWKEITNRHTKNKSLTLFDNVEKQWVLRFDAPHRNSPEPHINVNKKYTAKKDPHTPITEKQLKISKNIAKGVKYANATLHGASLLCDLREIYGACFGEDWTVKKCLSTTQSIVVARMASLTVASEVTLGCMKTGMNPVICACVVAPVAAVASELLVEKAVKSIYVTNPDEKKSKNDLQLERDSRMKSVGFKSFFI